MRVELKIFELPKLPNQLLGAKWYVRSSHAKKWHRLVDAHLRYVGHRQQSPLEKARVSFARCSPRRCDYDGLVGSFKPVLDALVKCGVLLDDTLDRVELQYEWLKMPRELQHICVTVEGV